jgi:TPR repeat protein
MLMRCLLMVLVCFCLQSCSTARQAEQLELGKRSFSEGDYKQAFHQLLPAASEGNAKAQYAVGYMYYYGYGVSQDTESGLFWMRKAAAQHYDPAMRALQKLHD